MGFAVPNINIIKTDNIKALAVERFDRRWTKGSSNALENRYNFMRFQVFQWLIGATDGHAKNFSIYIGKGGSYRLTPFYDILSAYPLLASISES